MNVGALERLFGRGIFAQNVGAAGKVNQALYASQLTPPINWSGNIPYHSQVGR